MNAKKGFTLVELLVVIGILGVLMGALFPAISSAMTKANLNACGMRGRNLFVAITGANAEREAIGMGNVWPKTQAEEGADADDKIANGTATVVDYFKALFDTENMQNPANWKPYVQGIDLGVLAGAGVPVAASATALAAKNILWSIAANVQDELDDVVPVLFSRNLAANNLISSGSYNGQAKEIKLGKDGGAKYDTPFAAKAYVVVRKGGAVLTQTAKYCSHQVIYNRQSFTIPTATEGGTFTYLEP